MRAVLPNPAVRGAIVTAAVVVDRALALAHLAVALAAATAAVAEAQRWLPWLWLWAGLSVGHPPALACESESSKMALASMGASKVDSEAERHLTVSLSTGRISAVSCLSVRHSLNSK